jgi:hypothetical protein
MKTVLIPGKNLTNEQIELLPYKGKRDKLWLECHSFYFSECGTKISSNENEKYPVCNSLAFLPY